MGINCVAPRLVESFFKGINKGRKSNPVPLITYPNSGETYKVELGYVKLLLCELFKAKSKQPVCAGYPISLVSQVS